MPVPNRIAALAPEMTEWRHHLHAHPELMFDVHDTAAFVADKLRAFGVDEVVEGVGRTGVVGLIHGQGEGPVMGLRADMDALPIEEAPDRPWKSTVPGRMHACGHDGHSTILLGAAKYLAETRAFAGTVAVIFQPAEEGGGSGRVMVEDGLMDRFGIGRVFALHNWPGLPLGEIEVSPGPAMAAADEFAITVEGTGAHAAYPHKGVDPVLVASHIVTALQGLVARETSPLASVVVSVTQFHAGSAFNVIPARAELRGTVRTLDEDLRQRTVTRMREMAEGIAAAHGARATLDYSFGNPVTVNDADQAAFAAEVARDVAGAANVRDTRPPEMGGEDFSFMLQARPGAYIFLGQGDSAPLHHPDYDFNDEAAPLGASLFARLVEIAQPAR